MRILLVEDNQVNCFLLCDYLEFCGYSVQAITASELFFFTLELFKPNLILLDIKMPKIDGYTLLKEMQSQERWRHIPVVVISALSFRSHQEKALELGARRYIVKPIVPDILKNIIEEELSHLGLECNGVEGHELGYESSAYSGKSITEKSATGKSTVPSSILTFDLGNNVQVC